MSARGEFLRILSECRALLAGCGVSEAESWVKELDVAADEAVDDLEAAARRALTLCESAPAPDLTGASERQEHAARCDHLVAICRVILGR